MEVGDTLHPTARALNGRGDSVAAEIFWSSLDTAIVVVVDSATGATRGKAVGPGRVQARFGSLRSNPQNLAVLVRVDSASAAGDTIIVSADSLSDSLVVKAWAGASGAAGRTVVYGTTIYPAGATNVTLVPTGTAQTDATGIVARQLRLNAGPLPDSVVVTAAVRRPNGSNVPGSPVRFVVEFQP